MESSVGGLEHYAVNFLQKWGNNQNNMKIRNQENKKIRILNFDIKFSHFFSFPVFPFFYYHIYHIPQAESSFHNDWHIITLAHYHIGILNI
jgi:hypothetical protein